jgi:2-oxoglutarate dehydrogenase E2 component (dihydrolipoamide succinyltransferase)
MAVTVTLPRLGESVMEGTITRWLKKEGDWVDEDESLVEISTDKIDTELPSPASGTIAKISVREGGTVDVGTEICVIDETAKKGEAPKAAAKTGARDAGAAAAEPPREAAEAPREEPRREAPREEPRPAAPPAAAPAAKAPALAGNGGRRELGVLSPLVRKLAREHEVDLSEVRGTGQGGRITKQDVLAFVQARATRPLAAGTLRPAPEVAPSPFATPTAATQEVEFSRVRKLIAEHMSRSRKTAAHVTNVVEVDMTRVAMLRERVKGSFRDAEGFNLSYLPFVARATVEALRAFPQFNAHLAEDKATLHRQVHLGIAVGRDEGLIVPVVKGADGMNLVGLARGINDVAARARSKGGLKPDDVSGGTFTITNNGSFGAIIDTPIINQPQVAILGVGAIVKRPAVITVDGADAIGIRHMMFLSLSYDHRWIDGHTAAQFNSRVKQILEAEDFAPEFGLAPETT